MQRVRKPQIIVKVAEAANRLFRQGGRTLGIAKRAHRPAHQVLATSYAPCVPNGFRSRRKFLASGKRALVVAQLVSERAETMDSLDPIVRARRVGQCKCSLQMVAALAKVTAGEPE